MKFNSLRAYFYKLHNLLYLALLPPLIGFTFLYLENYLDIVKDTVLSVRLGLALAIFLLLIGLSWSIRKRRLKIVRSLVSLNDRLEQYASVSINQFFILSAASYVLVLSFYLMKDQLFIALFGMQLILYSVYWPTPRRVCRDLRLKKDEREVVINKIDFLP